jgi:enoyl-[acyl-carrier-protein] reductase (NADH)
LAANGENIMLLENKNAITYGAAGSVGGAVARAFAREGAHVFLTGRNLGALDVLAKEISAAGGAAETAQVDALDADAVEAHLDAVVDKAGTVDISFNAIGIPQQGMQGIAFTELSLESFSLPITTYAQAQFLTGRAAARHMIAQRSGVVLMHTPEPARLGSPLLGGMAPAWAAMESLNRGFSGEWAQSALYACARRAWRRHRRSTSSSGFTPRDMESPKRNSGPPWPQTPTGNVRPPWRNSAKWPPGGIRSGRRNDRDRCQSDRRNHRRLSEISRMIPCRTGQPLHISAD